MELEYIGPERAEEVSEIAYPLFAEVYDYVPRDMLDEFLEERRRSYEELQARKGEA